MSLELSKLDLIEQILKLQEEDTIERIRLILDEENSGDWWNDLPSEEKSEIEKGIEQADAGELIPHEKVMHRFNR